MPYMKFFFGLAIAGVLLGTLAWWMACFSQRCPTGSRGCRDCSRMCGSSLLPSPRALRHFFY